MTKAKSKRSKSNTKAKRQAKPRKKQTAPIETSNPDCPYRPNTLYGTLFVESNRGYVEKNELIKKVAEKTGKSEKVVNFAFQVLKSPKHRSNKNRSTELTEDGKVKLILIRKNA
jgi:hypothetical protein